MINFSEDHLHNEKRCYIKFSGLLKMPLISLSFKSRLPKYYNLNTACFREKTYTEPFFYCKSVFQLKVL